MTLTTASGTHQTYGQDEERNRILRVLPVASYTRLRPYLEVVELAKKQVLWNADESIESVYFPQTCALSFIVTLEERAPVEAATIGNEGIAGASAALGAEHGSMLVLAQIPGAAARVSTHIFRSLVEDDASLRLMALRSAHALLEQAAQSVACNRRHSTLQRCARWILMTHDRAHTEEFPLTHQMLSIMLGVRRASVTTVALALQKRGLITYVYGRLSVRDRVGLEEVACECYDAVQRRFHRLFGSAA